MAHGAKAKVSTGVRTELLAEYASLREEILKRIGFRQQLNTILLSAAVALLGALVVVGHVAIAFILPVLVVFMALSWVHNDFRIGQLGKHIREEIETSLDGVCWETSIQGMRDRPNGGWPWRRTVVSQTGVFLVVQAASVLLGVLNLAPSQDKSASAAAAAAAAAAQSEMKLVLIHVGVACVVVMLIIMVDGFRRAKKLA